MAHLLDVEAEFDRGQADHRQLAAVRQVEVRPLAGQVGLAARALHELDRRRLDAHVGAEDGPQRAVADLVAAAMVGEVEALEPLALGPRQVRAERLRIAVQGDDPDVQFVGGERHARGRLRDEGGMQGSVIHSADAKTSRATANGQSAVQRIEARNGAAGSSAPLHSENCGTAANA